MPVGWAMAAVLVNLLVGWAIPAVLVNLVVGWTDSSELQPVPNQGKS